MQTVYNSENQICSLKATTEPSLKKLTALIL